MKITTNEVKLFEDTINSCKRSVLVVVPSGERYDLKTIAGGYAGVAALLKQNDWQEPELFASCTEDEMTLFGFIRTIRTQAG